MFLDHPSKLIYINEIQKHEFIIEWNKNLYISTIFNVKRDADMAVF